MAIKEDNGAEGVYNTRDCSMNVVKLSNRMGKAGDAEPGVGGLWEWWPLFGDDGPPRANENWLLPA